MKLTNFLRIAPAMAALGTAPFASATPITVDEVLFAVDSGNPGLGGQLLASADMTFSSNILTVTLRNLTGASSSSSSFVMLTGIGFNLPNGMSISGGSAALAAGSSPVNWTTGNLSTEWGYNNGPIGNGHFNGSISTGGVNAVASSMGSDAPSRLMLGSINNGDKLNGPDFGILSANGTAGGLAAVRDSVVITLNLSGTYGGSLLQYIESNEVVVTFASPDSSYTRVPDSGATLTLMGAALLGVALLARRKS